MKSFLIIPKKSNTAAAGGLLVSAMAALLILLWVYTASSKLMEFSVFQFQMQLHPLPDWLAALLGWSLPPAELALAALLAIPKTRYTGLCLSFVALLSFTVYILWLLVTQDHIPCACGGPISGFTWWQHIAFNLFFAFAALGAVGLINKNQ
ncbi:MAG TPA: MauE/DoxX family redox-associated membrane protein [Anseongella sp.]